MKILPGTKASLDENTGAGYSLVARKLKDGKVYLAVYLRRRR